MKKLIRIVSLSTILALLVVSVAAAKDSKENAIAVLANIDPFEVGTASVNINQFLATDIKVKDITVSLDPRTNVVQVKIPHQGVKVIWYLTEENRKNLVSAFASYNTDFESKKLKTSGSKKAYGIETIFVKWGILQLTAQAAVKTQLGYKFIDKAPYFGIISPVTPNELFDVSGGTTPRSSSFLALYFTRAQAAAFTDLLSQDYLLQKLAEQNVPENLLPQGQKDLNAPDVY